MAKNNKIDELTVSVLKRHDAHNKIDNKIKEYFDGEAKFGWDLAATDLYVERLEQLLTLRVAILYFCGVIAGLLFLFLMYHSIVFTVSCSPLEVLGYSGGQGKTCVLPFTESVTKTANVDEEAVKEVLSSGLHFSLVAVYFIKVSSVAALVGATAYFLASLTKALLHEATVVLNRRKALRFGRLYVHLNRDNLTEKDIEKIFKSTDEFSTAFKDIKYDFKSQEVLMKLNMEMFEILKRLAKQER